ncbi:MAG: ATP phosphoribosyltransferase regulatory subunit, partial [Oscillospiraceae bacterium]|nr:ATP phosphoribosyltransferase regulatory subunit [Oscillospiraceae bacterium]
LYLYMTRGDDLMTKSENMQKTEDDVIILLRDLYESYGFKKFKMKTFEEYSLYIENKNFLSNNQIITFTGLNGKLLALKPDITLSIIKNCDAAFDNNEKYYYNENVYRPHKNNYEYKEIPQMGLELIGNIDSYSILETVSIAIKTLKTITNDYLLDISDLDFIGGILDTIDCQKQVKLNILSYIKQKNDHDLKHYAKESGLSKSDINLLSAIVNLYGPFPRTLKICETIVNNEKSKRALNNLKSLYHQLKFYHLHNNIRLDFSIINDLDYYNGIIFQGFVKQVPNAVLSGGRYDKMVKRFGINASAIGFALYIDELDKLFQRFSKYDVDAFVLYKDDTDPIKVMGFVNSLISDGKSVRAEKSIPKNLTYSKLYNL